MKIVVGKKAVYYEWVVEVKYYQIRGTLLIPLRFCVFSHKLTPIPFGETADLHLANAEHLNYYFYAQGIERKYDLIFSFGVIHHSVEPIRKLLFFVKYFWGIGLDIGFRL